MERLQVGPVGEVAKVGMEVVSSSTSFIERGARDGMRAVCIVALVAHAHALLLPARCCAPAAGSHVRATACMRMPWDPVEAAEDGDAEPKEVKKGIDFSGLAQLVTMGAGAPMLGDLVGTNFDKSEAEGGAALQFELEANNFEDEKGNIKSGAYRDEGWVDEDYVDPMEALKKMWPFGK